MEQCYLDPRRTEDITEEWIPPGPIPGKVRQFGFYPNVDDWLPGDLILVSNIQPNWTHHVIERVQRLGGYSENDARWHHAAVYLGSNGEICEADVGGVIHSSINRYNTGRHLIRVRRDPDIESDKRWRIAIRSLTKLKQGYAYGYLIHLLFLARSGFDKLNFKFNELPKKTKICSQLYKDAYTPITNKMLENPQSGEITPAFLSFTRQLQDVSVTWKKIQ